MASATKRSQKFLRLNVKEAKQRRAAEAGVDLDGGSSNSAWGASTIFPPGLGAHAAKNNISSSIGRVVGGAASILRGLVLQNKLQRARHVPLLSDDVKDLLQRMLCTNRNNRITMKEILAHPWLSDSRHTQASEREIRDDVKRRDELFNTRTGDYIPPNASMMAIRRKCDAADTAAARGRDTRRAWWVKWALGGVLLSTVALIGVAAWIHFKPKEKKTKVAVPRKAPL
jgi:hypothetical protein